MNDDLFQRAGQSLPIPVLLRSTLREGFYFDEYVLPGVGDGTTPSAYYLHPAGDAPHPLIMFSHWLAPEADANKTEFLREAEELSAAGYACLLIDTVFADWPKSRLNWTGTDFTFDRSIVVRQIAESRAYLSFFRARPEVDPARVALVGHDFGAMFNAILAGIEGGIKACAIMAAIPDFAGWFTLQNKMGPAETATYYAELACVAPKDYLKRAEGTSFLFQFGKDDMFFVPTERAENLAGSVPGPKQVRWYDCDHAVHRNEAASAERGEWIKKILS